MLVVVVCYSEVVLTVLQEKDSEKDITSYTVLVLEKNSVEISDLTPATAYLFRVQAQNPEGGAGTDSEDFKFETLPEGEGNVRYESPLRCCLYSGGQNFL